jgi:hypothetical protein
VTAFWAIVKDVVTRHQHIALRDDDLAPVTGRAVVLACWGWDGHGLIAKFSLRIWQHFLFNSQKSFQEISF